MLNIPSSARANVFIPKEKFYQIGDVTGKIKRLFIDEIERVTLVAVIAPRTMNISGKIYEELDIIEIKLKTRDISLKALEAVDKVIPRPVLFCIVRPSGEIKYITSYKEPKAKEVNKSKIIQYYATKWNVTAPVIKGNSVKAIYLNFIEQVEPGFDKAKPIAEAVADTKNTEKIKYDIAKLNQQIKSEPSVAKKQEMARKRHELEQRLANT